MGRTSQGGGEGDKVRKCERVLFIPYTEKSELAKRVRRKLEIYESISCIKVRVVEKTGERVMDTLHRSDPWEKSKCKRSDCKMCE